MSGGPLTLRVEDAGGAAAVDPPPSASLPVTLTARLAASLKLTASQTATVTLNRRPTEIKVAAVVDRLPGTTPDQPAIQADWQTMQLRTLAVGLLAALACLAVAVIGLLRRPRVTL